jgi:phospholipid/cholesterol/gamma-HCH transport system permease protein
MGPVAVLGAWGERVLRESARMSRFCGQLVYWMFTGVPRRRVLVPIMYEIGVRSVPVVLATGAFVGMVLAVQMYGQLHKVGVENLAGMIINLSMVKQIGPVLAAVILAGRIGGGMTAELGTMRVTEQIDALTAMGTDPVYHLVVPRVLATVMLIPILTAFSDAIGVLGGYLITVKVFGANSHFYWYHSAVMLESWDVMEGILKTLLFGGLIAVISCYQGFNCGHGAEGVGRACTKAFVMSFMAILVVNFFVAVFTRTLYVFLWPK